MTDFFKDLKVVELSTVLAGPHVGMFFAELGAQVLKIEHPQKKDVTREWKSEHEDKNTPVSAYFSSVNYNKIYKSADLSLDEGKNILFNELQDADILLMNFKKGGADKLGIGINTLRKKFPRLIIGHITGFGDDDTRVAYDLILQAESGFMSMNGTPESGPTKMPVALIDLLAAHQLKEAILIALLQREQTKKGVYIEVSLYETAVSSLVNQASNWLMAKHNPQRIGSLHPNIAPYGEIFKTKDARLITFAIGNQKQFENLLHILRLERLVDKAEFINNQERVKNRSVLENYLQKAISDINADEILEICHKSNIPAGEIKDIPAVFQSETAKKLILKEDIQGVKTQRVKSFIPRFDE